MDINSLTLTPAKREELPLLCEKMQEAFSAAVGVEDGAPPLPPVSQLTDAWGRPGFQVLCIRKNGEIVGAAVVKGDAETAHNTLDLFFVCQGMHSRGLGLEAWRAIEAAYPRARTWELITPYYEKRNIHFYVNKCGFHIVEYVNAHHPDPNGPQPEDGREDDGYFRFVKEREPAC